MMKIVVTLLVALLAVAVVSDTPTTPTFGTTNIVSQTNNGFDVILLDTPSWVHSIEFNMYNRTDAEFYVFGDRTLRKVHAGNYSGSFSASGFYAEGTPYSTDSFYMNDLHAFSGVVNGINYQYSVGIAQYDADNSVRFGPATGAYNPIVITRQALNGSGAGNVPWQYVQPALTKENVDFRGFLMSAIRCDDYTFASMNTTVAYMAGFQTTNNVTTGATGVNFVLLRAGFDHTPGNGGISQFKGFDYDANKDVVSLYSNGFTSFSATYKPWIHLMFGVGPNLNSNYALVIDPSSQAIYLLDVTAVDQAPKLLDTSPVPTDSQHELVSVDYEFKTRVLVIGLSSYGMAPGTIAVYNFSTSPTSIKIPPANTFVLPSNYSNPKALAFDRFTTHLYIGFNGYNEILRYNLGVTPYVIDGYQRLPEYLHRSWEGIATPVHVYFVTNEQNSKVFRVDKEDFCSSPCPYFGFCQKGKCVCSEYFQLSKDKSTCELAAAAAEIVYINKYHKAHGGEVALGVLFALTFVAGAVGWVLWHRSRRASYQAV
jgi:hypothetical protein